MNENQHSHCGIVVAHACPHSMIACGLFLETRGGGGGERVCVSVAVSVAAPVCATTLSNLHILLFRFVSTQDGH